MSWQVGKLSLRADFDSANLAKVQAGAHDMDLELWTRHDNEGRARGSGISAAAGSPASSSCFYWYVNTPTLTPSARRNTEFAQQWFG